MNILRGEAKDTNRSIRTSSKEKDKENIGEEGGVSRRGRRSEPERKRE